MMNSIKKMGSSLGSLMRKEQSRYLSKVGGRVGAAPVSWGQHSSPIYAECSPAAACQMCPPSVLARHAVGLLLGRGREREAEDGQIKKRAIRRHL